MTSFSTGSVLFRPQTLLAAAKRWSLYSSSPTAMPAADRTILFLLQRHHRPLQSSSSRRLLSYTTTRPAAAAAPPKTALRRVVPISYAEQLASKAAPTALYEAPSHFWYRASSISAGVFCVAYSTYHYLNVVVNRPEGLSGWTVSAFAVVVGFMGSMGVYFFLGIRRVVRRIQVVPGPLPTKAAAAAASRPPAPGSTAAKAAAKGFTAAATPAKPATGGNPIHLEVSVSRLIPFARPRIVRVDPADVVLPARFTQLRAAANAMASGPQLTHRQQAQAAAAERAARKAEAEYDRANLLTSPFRHVGKALRQAWLGISRALHREGFAKIQIEGKEYKLDISGGWALEDGRSLDRLVTIEETQGKKTVKLV